MLFQCSGVNPDVSLCAFFTLCIQEGVGRTCEEEEELNVTFAIESPEEAAADVPTNIAVSLQLN